MVLNIDNKKWKINGKSNSDKKFINGRGHNRRF